jgi:hypothetical protein
VGSNADELVQRTAEGVVLVGRSFDQRMEHDFERVIVALDGTSTGDALCEKAASWAKMFGLGIQLVTFSEDTPAPLREGEDPFERFGLDGDAQAYVVTMMERLHAQGVETTGLAFSDPISPASGIGQLVRDQKFASHRMFPTHIATLQRAINSGD